MTIIVFPAAPGMIFLSAMAEMIIYPPALVMTPSLLVAVMTILMAEAETILITTTTVMGWIPSLIMVILMLLSSIGVSILKS